MVEPTESENLEELDRFCDGDDRHPRRDRPVAAGEWPRDDNPLVNAPHTQARVTADEWTHPYSRGGSPPSRPACTPDRSHADGFDKYWPPVARIDGAYGDRNLVCSCPPPEAYES